LRFTAVSSLPPFLHRRQHLTLIISAASSTASDALRQADSNIVLERIAHLGIDRAMPQRAAATGPGVVDVLRTQVGRERLVELATSPAGTDAKECAGRQFGLDDRASNSDLPLKCL
jgi:hypothetical protein